MNKNIIGEGYNKQMSENESHIVKNHNQLETQRVMKKIVKTILLPRAMSTYQGQYGTSKAFGIFQEIVRNSLKNKPTNVKEVEMQAHSKYLARLKEDGIIRWQSITKKLLSNAEPSVNAIQLTKEGIRIANLFKDHPYEMDDYHIASVLWCLSRANIAEDREREVRFGYVETILYMSLQSMAELEEGRVLWTKSLRPSIFEFKRWLKTTGSKDRQGRSDITFGNAANYLDKSELQSMLSFSGLLDFDKDKIDMAPLYSTVKKLFSHQTLKTIEKTLQTAEIVTQKVDKAIESEKETIQKSVEFAP